MGYIDHITEFLFNENRRLSSKAAVVVFVMFALFLVDNITGFSFNISMDKKIEQVQKLNAIIKDTTVDSTTKAFALQRRSEIIERENVIDQSRSFFRNIKLPNSKKPQSNIPKEPAKTNESIIKNNFWFHISSGGLYYLLAVLMLPLIIVTDKKTSLGQRIASGIVAVIFFYFIGSFFYWVCNYIPLISKSTWAFNHIINIIIQFGVLALIIFIYERKKKSRSN